MQFIPINPHKQYTITNTLTMIIVHSMFDERLALVAAYVVMMVSNILSTATNVYNHTNNMAISRENPTVLTPDGITFSVWALIYSLHTYVIIYQYTTDWNALKKARPYLIAAYLTNGLWLPIFAYEFWWLALLIIVSYTFLLYKAYTEFNVDYCQSTVGRRFAMASVSSNLAWVVFATLLNIAIVMRNSRIIMSTRNGELLGGDDDWAVSCIVLAVAVALYFTNKATDFVYSAITTWALLGVYRHQEGPQTCWAVICAIALVAFTVSLTIVQCIQHYYKYEEDPLSEPLRNP